MLPLSSAQNGTLMMPLAAPSTVAPSMIVNSGAPLTNAAVSNATGTLTKIARNRTSAPRMIHATGDLLAISVPRSRPLGRQLAAQQVAGVDREVQDGVERDQRGADEDRRDDVGVDDVQPEKVEALVAAGDGDLRAPALVEQQRDRDGQC